jgi:hypothetical protein
VKTYCVSCIKTIGYYRVEWLSIVEIVETYEYNATREQDAKFLLLKQAADIAASAFYEELTCYRQARQGTCENIPSDSIQSHALVS